MKKKKVALSQAGLQIDKQEELTTIMIRQARERCRFANKLIKMKVREKDV